MSRPIALLIQDHRDTVVHYEYEVDGQIYSGSRYSLGDGSTASDRTWNTETEARQAAANAY